MSDPLSRSSGSDTRRLNMSWPDNSWRPMLFVGNTVVLCKTRAVMRRCWREVRREVHLARFGRYPTAKWGAFS